MSGQTPGRDNVPADQMRREAARRYRAGQTLREVAEQSGVSNTTVHRWLTQEGVTGRRTGPRGRVEISDQQIRILRYVEKLSYRAIGELVGLSGTAVRNRYLATTSITPIHRPPETRGVGGIE